MNNEIPVILFNIDDYDGYFISIDGRVFSNLGKGNRRNGKVTDLYEIKPRYTKTGYARVYLRNSITNKRKDVYIHRIIGQRILPNPHNKKFINHKDCNPKNNDASNLEWCTTKENIDYALNVGNMTRNERGHFSRKSKSN